MRNLFLNTQIGAINSDAFADMVRLGFPASKNAYVQARHLDMLFDADYRFTKQQHFNMKMSRHWVIEASRYDARAVGADHTNAWIPVDVIGYEYWTDCVTVDYFKVNRAGENDRIEISFDLDSTRQKQWYCFKTEEERDAFLEKMNSKGEPA